jgi:hypothetical protein
MEDVGEIRGAEGVLRASEDSVDEDRGHGPEEITTAHESR